MFDELGQTADQVAKSLRARRIRGVRYAARLLNPVVRYARRFMPDAIELQVVRGRKLRIVSPGGTIHLISLPAPVVDFLRAFNRGQFLDLEAADLF
jgi:hypothetical protein